ncbi:putative sepiapterin reductase [Ancylostoma caninum]|uniref:Putative sepiapterin reductase n=1 Tax=Ancylostoma caninum TaxID=29170 RepID=A0A368G693_ANCCA|nr:putative sepiapterin reductase [Ancylostoma caninum]
MVLSGKRVLTVVSGASRGIGKEIAVQVSKRVAPDSEMGPFESAFVFHNCGTAGDVSKRSTELSNAEQWQNYLNVNLIAMVQFNNLILEAITKEVAPHRFIVNITSLVAIQGFPSLTQYSVGKAAREAFFRVLAVEDDTIKVLSYSPGPVDTAMHDVIAKESFDEGIRAAFSQNTSLDHEAHRCTLTPTQTVVKMLKHLENDTFQSGARIDYFDDE